MKAIGGAGIEWTLQTFASMRAVHLVLRARAVIKFLMQAASTLEITNGKQRALRNFSASWNLSLHQVIWLTPSKQDNNSKARQHDEASMGFNYSQ